MSRSRRAADRIREEVRLLDVLISYGYEVDYRGERQHNFSCDLHGDGNDNTPSATFYPDSPQFYCHACGKSRDAIGLVREKENLSFWDAIRLLEKKFNLEPLPWETEDNYVPLAKQVEEKFNTSETPERSMNRLHQFLLNLSRERGLQPEKCVALWEAHDRIAHHMKQNPEDRQGSSLALSVLEKAKDALKKERDEHSRPA